MQNNSECNEAQQAASLGHTTLMDVLQIHIFLRPLMFANCSNKLIVSQEKCAIPLCRLLVLKILHKVCIASRSKNM